MRRREAFARFYLSVLDPAQHIQPEILPEADGEYQVAQQAVQDGREEDAAGFGINMGQVETGCQRQNHRERAVIEDMHEAERQSAGRDELDFTPEKRSVTSEQKCAKNKFLQIGRKQRVENAQRQPDAGIAARQVEEV